MHCVLHNGMMTWNSLPDILIKFNVSLLFQEQFTEFLAVEVLVIVELYFDNNFSQMPSLFSFFYFFLVITVRIAMVIGIGIVTRIVFYNYDCC